MRKVKNREDGRVVHPWDRIPIILKSVSGFNSCLTVATMSIIFIVSINTALERNVGDWPTIGQMLLMMMGPVVIAWHFVNAKSIIATILTPDGTSESGTVEKKLVIPTNTGILTEDDVAIERELVGPVTVILRAIAGFVATHSICFCSLFFTWTVHNALIIGKEMPSDIKLFLIVIGPIVTSWNFVRASSTISTVLSGASALKTFRAKMAGIIDPK